MKNLDPLFLLFTDKKTIIKVYKAIITVTFFQLPELIFILGIIFLYLIFVILMFF